MTIDVPRQTVAMFRLPIPVSAMPVLLDTIERVYGTGETMMRPQGEFFTIIEPEGGFGPVKRTRRRPADPDPDDMLIRDSDSPEPGSWTFTFQAGEDIVKVISGTLAAWFDQLGATNYVECALATADNEPDWTFRLQKRVMPTPHDLRLTAETALANLNTALEQCLDPDALAEVHARAAAIGGGS